MRIIMALLLACLVFAGHVPSPCAFAGQTSTQASAASQTSTADLSAKLAEIESKVESKRKETGVPGLSVAIVKDDRLIFAKGFGMRDVEHSLPVTPDTLMAIGSATKAFTAMAAAISVDQGKLAFDDPPVKYLPYFKLQDPDANSKVTLRDMLSHKTGLASYTDLPWYLGTLNRQEVIRVIGDAKPTAPIRTKFQYNNVMFSAAGEVVAAVQHTSWENVISNLIFKPLGMTSSDTSVKEMQKTADFSRGYAYDDDSKTTTLVPTRDITNIAAAGAINSNVKDMSRWVRLILDGGEFEGKRLVSEKSYHELTSTQTPVGPGISYGFGWVLASWNGHPTIWHNGGIDGFHSLVEMMPDQHLG
ncbi:MAG TPA: serine hydrolase domain-containing protein, partial [Blastocatellia bacterium]|nr:serine hydrolase domain-containing protein [Blastocatellia bacterium]